MIFPPLEHANIANPVAEERATLHLGIVLITAPMTETVVPSTLSASMVMLEFWSTYRVNRKVRKLINK